MQAVPSQPVRSVDVHALLRQESYRVEESIDAGVAEGCPLIVGTSVWLKSILVLLVVQSNYTDTTFACSYSKRRLLLIVCYVDFGL